eukprot:12674-Heterococcus_DN1.PRE.4
MTNRERCSSECCEPRRIRLFTDAQLHISARLVRYALLSAFNIALAVHLFDQCRSHCVAYKPLQAMRGISELWETQGDGGAKSSLRSQSMSAVDDSAERGREFADAQLFPPPARQILSVKRLVQTTRSTQTAAPATATFTAMASPVVEVTAVAVAEAQLFSDDNDENIPCAATISTTAADSEATVC